MHSGKQKNKLLCLCSYIRDKTLPTAVYLISSFWTDKCAVSVLTSLRQTNVAATGHHLIVRSSPAVDLWLLTGELVPPVLISLFKMFYLDVVQ